MIESSLTPKNIMNHPSHLDNFKSANGNRFAIVESEGDGKYFEYASGKTTEQATERFYSRFMNRACDREMMLQSQRRNGLVMQHIKDNARHFVEGTLFLIA